MDGERFVLTNTVTSTSSLFFFNLVKLPSFSNHATTACGNIECLNITPSSCESLPVLMIMYSQCSGITALEAMSIMHNLCSNYVVISQIYESKYEHMRRRNSPISMGM